METFFNIKNQYIIYFSVKATMINLAMYLNPIYAIELNEDLTVNRNQHKEEPIKRGRQRQTTVLAMVENDHCLQNYLNKCCFNPDYPNTING